MSEQEKIAYLQEKIAKTRRNGQVIATIFTLGAILAFAGFSFMEPKFLGSRGLWLGIFGTSVAVLALIRGVANNMR